jgi:hypothetical protein
MTFLRRIKLHNEDVHDTHCLPYIIRLMVHVARKNKTNAYGIVAREL